jgi:8-oxo-dGTP diphosphatase
MVPPSPNRPAAPLPYKIATLCDLRDRDGRILLLRRVKPPNQGLCSPIGGKLDMGTGESPAQSAQREIREEAGIDVPIERLHLGGLISEAGYEGQTHWLMFYYRVLGAVDVEPTVMNEGSLEWHALSDLDHLPVPESDREVIWPLVRSHEALGPELPAEWLGTGSTRHDPATRRRPGFFAVHIDCTGPRMTWTVEHREDGR